jgi:hypothetical protein
LKNGEWLWEDAWCGEVIRVMPFYTQEMAAVVNLGIGSVGGSVE